MNEVTKINQSNILNLLMQFDTRHYQAATTTKRGFFVKQYTVGDDQNNIVIQLEQPPDYAGKLTLDDFSFSVTTHRLFMYIRELFTIRENAKIDFSIKDYMRLCDLEDRKHARKQLERDLFALSAVRFYDLNGDYYIIERFEMHHKRVYLELHYSIVEEINAHKGYILLPKNYYKINVQRFHAAPGLLYYLLLLRYMNNAKTNKNRVSIQSMLTRGHFPTVELVRSTKNNNIKARITDPFFQTIGALKNMVTFRYFNEYKEELTEREVRNLEFDDMVRIIAHFRFKHEK